MPHNWGSESRNAEQLIVAARRNIRLVIFSRRKAHDPDYYASEQDEKRLDS
jgi:hypothetical protein